MIKSNVRIFIAALALAACGGAQAKLVVMPSAATLAEKDRSYILKADQGMTMACDGTADPQADNWVRYAVAPGEHQLDVTVYKLIAETGYTYKGPPLHWKGTITTKPGLFYEISAEANAHNDGVDLRMTSHVRPLVNYEEDRVLGPATE